MKTPIAGKSNILSIIISLALVLSMVPASAWATSEDAEEKTSVNLASDDYIPFGERKVYTLDSDSFKLCMRNFYFTVPSNQNVNIELDLSLNSRVSSGLCSLMKSDGTIITLGTVASGLKGTIYLEAGTYHFNVMASFTSVYGYIIASIKVGPVPAKPQYNFRQSKKKVVVAWNGNYSINYYYLKNGKLSFTSSNKKVATVNSKGNTTLKGIGETKITTTQTETDDYAKSSFTYTLKVVPNRPDIIYADPLKRGIKLKWAKKSKKISSGYEIRYSTKKNMGGSKTKKINGASKSSAKIKGLKSGKTYYVQMRTFKKVDSKTYNSSWSKKQTVKTH